MATCKRRNKDHVYSDLISAVKQFGSATGNGYNSCQCGCIRMHTHCDDKGPIGKQWPLSSSFQRLGQYKAVFLLGLPVSQSIVLHI